MKRILAVMGSPRKNGNTHILVSRVIEGAQAGGAVVDELFLGDLTIRECDGCHACWKGKDCSKDDDMCAIYTKIIQSDVIIFGTPVYWYGPTALMKAFIDRLVYFNCPENRQKIKGLSAALAVPFEEDDPETARGVIEFFRKSLAYLEIKLLGQIIVLGVGEKGAIRSKSQSLQQAYVLGRELA
ncbi:MAG: flavodoxin family protein [Sedimentisphaerales bacterium]|nr:flavodoxin family protein [Sedimentisphaerales bacterium]